MDITHIMAVMIPRIWSLPRLNRRMVEGSTINIYRPKGYWRRWCLAYRRRMGAVCDGRVLAAKLEGFDFRVEDSEEGAKGGDARDHYGEIFFDAEELMLVSRL